MRPGEAGAGSEEIINRKIPTPAPCVASRPCPGPSCLQHWTENHEDMFVLRDRSRTAQVKPAADHRIDRYRGALVGLAVGDALGTTLEFQAPGSFEPIRDMVGGGPFGLRPGQWTDDTSMALCLADSLLACDGFGAADQMRRYRRWWKEGYRSSKGFCFDIGSTVRAALARFEESGEPYSGSTDPRSAGNGSLMRLAPIPLFFAAAPEEAIEWAGASSRITHGTATAVDACRYYAGLIVGALQGASKDELLSPFYRPNRRWDAGELAPEIAEVAAGSFRHRNPPAIRGTGYVVQSMEAALWAFAHAESFREGALAAVNLGDDADTTGAIFGQLGGAFWGMTAVPDEWLEKLWLGEEIIELADSLYAAARRPAVRHPATQT